MSRSPPSCTRPWPSFKPGRAGAEKSLSAATPARQDSSSPVRRFAASDAAVSINVAALLGQKKPEIMQELKSDPSFAQNPALEKIASMAVDRLSEVERVSIGALLAQGGVKLNINCHKKVRSMVI